MKENNNQNAYRRNNEMNRKINATQKRETGNIENKKEKKENVNPARKTNSKTDGAVKNAVQKAKERNARHTIKTGLNSVAPGVGSAVDKALDTEEGQKYVDAYLEGETPTQGLINVAGVALRKKYFFAVAASFLALIFFVGFIAVIAKNLPSILFGINGESDASEEWNSGDPNDPNNPYAEYQELYKKIEEEYEKVYNNYRIRIDKSLILATLTAPIGNEIFNDDKDDNEDDLDAWHTSGRQEYIMEAEVPLLARMQIMTAKSGDSSLCQEIRDMQHFAMNDEETGFWDNVLGFIFPWRFFRTEASKEKNYKCTSSVLQEFSGHETLVYKKSIEEGEYLVSEIGNSNTYDVSYDSNTGGVYFWNLVNEGGFIQSYYQKYLNTNSNTNEIDYEANVANIFRIAEEIYKYYEFIKDKECGEQIIYDTDITDVVIREESGRENTYELDYYVAGVMAAEFDSTFYTGDSEAVNLGYFDGAKNELNLEGTKAFAILVRTYAIYQMNSKGYLMNSSDDQNFNPNWEEGSNADVLRRAAEETSGMVVLANGELYMTQYDAICPISSYAIGDYYELPTSQRSIRISTAWGGIGRANAAGYLECPCGGSGKSYKSKNYLVDWDSGAEIKAFTNDLGKVDGTGYNCWEGGRNGSSPREPSHSLESYVDKATGEERMRDVYTYTYRPTGGHGNGASQYGIKYLALTGYDMEEIIKAFYERGYVSGNLPNESGNWTRGIEIGMMSNVKGVEEGQCKNPITASSGTGSGPVTSCGITFEVGEDHNYTSIIKGVALEEPLEDALAANGYSISCLNSCVIDRVRTAGPGTRAGVVEAAYGLIECMYEMTGGYTLPYDHSAGKVGSSNPDITGKLGVNSKWGKLGGSCNTGVCRYGLNCANFVRWSFCNGGMDLCSRGSAGAFSMTSNTYYPEQTTVEFRGSSVSGTDPAVNQMSLGELVRIAEPGDTITSDKPDGSDDHAMVIVGKDDSAYYVAENGRKTRRLSFSEITSGSHRYRLNLLYNYYANEANRNSLY